MMVTATRLPFSEYAMFGLQVPSEGDDTLTDFGFVTFGSSDGFEGENDGAPPMLTAEMIFVLSELRMCVAFTVPTLAVIFTLAGFEVPPELDPPEELLDVPAQRSSSDELEKIARHDASSTHASSFALGAVVQKDAQASVASDAPTSHVASFSSHVFVHVDSSAGGSPDPDDELVEDVEEPEPGGLALSLVVVQANAALVKRKASDGTIRSTLMWTIPGSHPDPSIFSSSPTNLPVSAS